MIWNSTELVYELAVPAYYLTWFSFIDRVSFRTKPRRIA